MYGLIWRGHASCDATARRTAQCAALRVAPPVASPCRKDQGGEAGGTAKAEAACDAVPILQPQAVAVPDPTYGAACLQCHRISDSQKSWYICLCHTAWHICRWPCLHDHYSAAHLGACNAWRKVHFTCMHVHGMHVLVLVLVDARSTNLSADIGQWFLSSCANVVQLPELHYEEKGYILDVFIIHHDVSLNTINLKAHPAPHARCQ